MYSMFYKLILLCVCIVHIYNILLLSSLLYTHRYTKHYKYTHNDTKPVSNILYNIELLI